MPWNWRTARRIAAALSMSAMCASCTSPRVLDATGRPNLPAAPSDFGKPVAMPQPRKGLDARLLAKMRGAALNRCNAGRLDDAEFYRDVQTEFGRSPE